MCQPGPSPDSPWRGARGDPLMCHRWDAGCVLAGVSCAVTGYQKSRRVQQAALTTAMWPPLLTITLTQTGAANSVY